MAASNNAQLVRRLWDLFQAREWDAARDLLTEDFAAEWPHSRERFRGRDAFIEMQRAYPEGWAIEVQRIVGRGGEIASEIRVTHAGRTFYAASFFEVRHGKLASVRELWVEEASEEPPEWRARWSERF